MRLDLIPKKQPNLASRAIEGEGVVLNLEEHCEDELRLNIFNETGTIIWELIDGKNSIEDIINKAALAYKVEPPKVEHEIRDFLLNLVKNKLNCLNP